MFLVYSWSAIIGDAPDLNKHFSPATLMTLLGPNPGFWARWATDTRDTGTESADIRWVATPGLPSATMPAG